MPPKALRTSLLGSLALLLVALLAVLAVYQYRWIGAVSRAERQRLQAAIDHAAAALASDFDRMLSELFLALAPERGARRGDDPGWSERLTQWRADAEEPALVRGLFRLRQRDQGAVVEALDAAGAAVPAAWPDPLRPLAEQLTAAVAGGGDPRRARQPLRSLPLPPFLDGRAPALVLPLLGARRWARRGERGRGTPVRAHGFLVVWLDAEVIVDRVLPALVARHVTPRIDDVAVWVLRGDDRSVLFRAGPQTPPPTPDDVRAGLFQLLPIEQLVASPPARRTAAVGGEGAAGAEPGGRPGRRRLRNPWYAFAGQRPPLWQLAVTHPAGSLESALAAARRSNLMIGTGILAVLAFAVLLLLAAIRRMQALAAQQMELVAGVSHELLTPLAAMRSAGQNLADGVVTDPAQVRRYGALVDREGRRLSTMVEQVLALAGMLSGRRRYRLQPVPAAAVIEQAVDGCRPLLDEHGMAVEVAVDEALPPLHADPAALRRALQNLIANAVKYGAEGRWIGLRARLDGSGEGSGGPTVALSVADRGPGIAAADRQRIFEPFFRGRAAVEEQIQGSGLGLSLVRDVVEAHGGRVEVEAREGGGSIFTLHLPTAEPR